MKKYKLSLRSGAYVKSVVENGKTIEAGLKAGDVITEINGIKIADYNFKQLLKYRQGDVITLKVYRDNLYEEFNVTF
jgi:serine protease Do